jgi:pantoate kinase
MKAYSPSIAILSTAFCICGKIFADVSPVDLSTSSAIANWVNVAMLAICGVLLKRLLNQFDEQGKKSDRIAKHLGFVDRDVKMIANKHAIILADRDWNE